MAKILIKFKGVTSTPTEWDKDTFYAVYLGGDRVECYITSSNGVPKQVGNTALIETIINDVLDLDNLNANPTRHAIAQVGGLNIEETVVSLQDFQLTGNTLSLTLNNENGAQQTVNVDLSSIQTEVDLDYTPAEDQGTITNTAGTDAVIPLATEEFAGLFSPQEKIILANLVQDGLVYPGVVTWSGVGFIYNVSQALIKLGGEPYLLDADTVTLDAADPTNPRIDVVYASPTGFGVLTGTPAAEPVMPQVDPSSQVFLTSIIVAANTTEPGDVTIEDIYQENVEYTGSFTGTGTVDFENDENPSLGTYAVKLTNIAKNNSTVFNKGSEIEINDYTSVSLKIDLQQALLKDVFIGIGFLDAVDNIISNEVQLPLNRNLVNTYQFVAVQTSLFNFTGTPQKIYIKHTRTSDGVYPISYFIDDWKLQGGISQPNPVTEHDSLQGIKGNGTFHLSEAERDKVNSALQSGDNISELIDDVGYALEDDIPVNTSELVNDGEDGLSPFITLEDVPPSAQADWDEVDTEDPAYILNKPENLSDFNDDIGATNAIVPQTIFVDTQIGDDSTAEIENYNRPFATDTAAYAAIPDDGKIWTIEYIDGNITRTMTSPFPNKSFIFSSKSGGVFDFSGLSGNQLLLPNGSYLQVYLPNATLKLHGATKVFGAGISSNNNNRINIKVKVIDVACGTSNNFRGIFSAPSSAPLSTNLLECEDFYMNNSSATTGIIMDFIGTFRVTQNFYHIGMGSIAGNGLANLFDVEINNLQKQNTDQTRLFNGVARNPRKISIKRISGTGNVLFFDYASDTTIVDFEDTIVENTISITMVNRVSGFNLIVRGKIQSWSGAIVPAGANTGNSTINFENFTGKVYITKMAWYTYNFTNCTINFANSMFVAENNYRDIKTITFKGFNSLVSNNNSIQLIAGADTGNVIISGTLTTNTKTIGNNINVTYETNTFKEKSKEIVIRDKRDIVNKVLDSETTYIIDGIITLGVSEFIEVPAGGLTIVGYSFDSSQILSTEAGNTIFKSPVGGSGNLLLNLIGITSSEVGSKVFDIVDVDGTHAIEMNDVNFNGCTSLGELNGYRQFTGTTIGIYGCSTGFTLSGTWNGFKITNTNAFGFGASGILFAEGTDLEFNNRFYIDMNVSLPTGAIISDVTPSNFNNSKLLQVRDCQVILNGAVDPDNITTLFPNIDLDDEEVFFANNVGLYNNYPLRTNTTDGNRPEWNNGTEWKGLAYVDEIPEESTVDYEAQFNSEIDF